MNQPWHCALDDLPRRRIGGLVSVVATLNRRRSHPRALVVHDLLVTARSARLTATERAALQRAPVRLADGRLARLEGVCPDGCHRARQRAQPYGAAPAADGYVVTAANGERIGCVSAYDLAATGLATF